MTFHGIPRRPARLMLAHAALLLAWTAASPSFAQGTAPAAPQRVGLAADVFFASGSDKLSADAVTTLRGLAQGAKGIKLDVIIVVGHADTTESLPEPLSTRRGEAAKVELVAQGIPEQRVYVEGRGAKAPVADNNTEAGRAKNRRVELEAVGTR